MKLGRDEIMQRMEQFKEGEVLKFAIPEIFGGGVAIIGVNPDHPKKQGSKKYLLKLADDEKMAEEAAPYYSSNKPKDLAKWVADRLGDEIA